MPGSMPSRSRGRKFYADITKVKANPFAEVLEGGGDMYSSAGVTAPKPSTSGSTAATDLLANVPARTKGMLIDSGEMAKNPQSAASRGLPPRGTIAKEQGFVPKNSPSNLWQPSGAPPAGGGFSILGSTAASDLGAKRKRLGA